MDERLVSQQEAALLDSAPVPTNRYLFKFICILTVLVAAQGGAVPAMLPVITGEFDLSFIQQGMLGGVVYVALSLACPTTGALFRRYNVKWVLCVSLCCFLLALAAFSLTPAHSAPLLITYMGLMGFSQAYLMVFAPVWLDEFAPEDSKTSWLSYLQSMTAFGVFLGYGLGAGTSWVFPDNECAFGISCWRFPFFMQGALLLPLVCAAMFVPAPHVQITLGELEEDNSNSNQNNVLPGSGIDAALISQTFAQREQIADPEGGGKRTRARTAASRGSRHSTGRRSRASASRFSMQMGSEIASSRAKDSRATRARLNSSFLFNPNDRGMVWYADFCNLMSNVVFVLVVLTLTGLYYVVTGVQFWATDYLITHMHGNPNTVYTLFIVCSASGPVLGVFFGGYICDQFGGYRKNPIRTLEVCLLFGVLAASCGLPATYCETIYGTVACLWGLLFFGGAVVPACTGIFISSVDTETRAFASSVSVIAFNLLGYGMSPISSALIMHATDSLEWGFRICLFTSMGPIMCLTAVVIYVKSTGYQASGSTPTIPEGDEQSTYDDYEDDYSNVTYEASYHAPVAQEDEEAAARPKRPSSSLAEVITVKTGPA